MFGCDDEAVLIELAPLLFVVLSFSVVPSPLIDFLRRVFMKCCGSWIAFFDSLGIDLDKLAPCACKAVVIAFFGFGLKLYVVILLRSIAPLRLPVFRPDLACLMLSETGSCGDGEIGSAIVGSIPILWEWCSCSFIWENKPKALSTMFYTAIYWCTSMGLLLIIYLTGLRCWRFNDFDLSRFFESFEEKNIAWSVLSTTFLLIIARFASALTPIDVLFIPAFDLKDSYMFYAATWALFFPKVVIVACFYSSCKGWWYDVYLAIGGIDGVLASLGFEWITCIPPVFLRPIDMDYLLCKVVFFIPLCHNSSSETLMSSVAAFQFSQLK